MFNSKGDLMQTIQKFHCIGCGRSIPWDGKGLFSYTCGCGATIFANDEHIPALPASLVLAIHAGRKPAHIDYYLGISNYASAEKQWMYEELKKHGAVWSWECEECKDRFLKLKKAQLDAGLLRIELLPELKALLS